MLRIYVDDMLVRANGVDKITIFEDALKETFEMSNLGLLHYYLGI